MSMNATEQSFFLPSHGRMLAATCFAPERAKAAVLVVGPFVEERKGTLPAAVKLARKLAQDGIATLLFDFSGCGDSDGDFADTPPEAFGQDCEAAYAWLAQVFPSVPYMVLGIRTGAGLAARLAETHPEVAALALWSPVAGADFFKQLAQRRMVNDMVAYGKATESRASIEARLQNGETVDMDGYPISGAFYRWLHEDAGGSRGRSPSIHLPTFLATGGHDEKAAAAAFPDAPALTRCALRYPPFWNTVGHVDLSALLGETTGWILPFAGEQWSVVSGQNFGTSELQNFRTLELPNFRTSRAVLDAPPAPPTHGALFLHGWSGDRAGPHRLFVRFARALSARGCLCIRPDFIGRGLSDGDDSDASISGMADTAQTALDMLRKQLPPDAPIAVVAICSGCKVAIALASRNPGISRLMLWSAESMGSLRSAATGSRKTLNALKTYLRKLTRPETWRKILTGKVQTGMVTKALVKHETRTKDEAAWEDSVLSLFAKHRNPVSFVFGGSDPDAAGSRQAYARYCAKHGIPHTQHTIPHAGHSYYSEAWTRELIAITMSEMSGANQ
ncbi:MAG: alpha/beta hydrolase [Kiritimatiellaeota bacterium]|nr:alpha/beta hydrolase [Kiritimatiellota bacterium]